MTTSKQLTGILVLVTAISALLLLGGTASASSRPSGMTKAEYRALMIRSQALNEKYGLGSGMTKAEYRALRLRSEALNRKYHLGAFAVTKPAIVARSDSFAWGDFAVGSVATLGGVLLAAGLIAGRRHGRGALRARSS